MKTIDDSGLALNSRLQAIISNMKEKEHDLGDKVDSVNDKIDSRASIKEDCCKTDREVTNLAEVTTNRVELLLKDLSRIIK